MSGPTFEVISLFPELVDGFLRGGLLGRAIDRGEIGIFTTNPRDHASDRYRTVDDAPFGGGAGMLMKVEPIVAALESVVSVRGPMHTILLSPSGARFNQSVARRLAQTPRIGLVCGRYEGVDDRIREHYVDECLSIGDFVLGGGELGALVVIETVARLCGGVVGNADSLEFESFEAAGLEFPQFTRPAKFRDHGVPSVLLGGDHAEIARWRLRVGIERSVQIRPDLPLPKAADQTIQVVRLEATSQSISAIKRILRSQRSSKFVVGQLSATCAVPTTEQLPQPILTSARALSAVQAIEAPKTRSLLVISGHLTSFLEAKLMGQVDVWLQLAPGAAIDESSAPNADDDPWRRLIDALADPRTT